MDIYAYNPAASGLLNHKVIWWNKSTENNEGRLYDHWPLQMMSTSTKTFYIKETFLKFVLQSHIQLRTENIVEFHLIKIISNKTQHNTSILLSI